MSKLSRTARLAQLLAEEGLVAKTGRALSPGTFSISFEKGSKSFIYLRSSLSPVGPAGEVVDALEKTWRALNQDAKEIGRGLTRLGLPVSYDEAWVGPKERELGLTKIVSFLTPPEDQAGHVWEVVMATGRKKDPRR